MGTVPRLFTWISRVLVILVVSLVFLNDTAPAAFAVGPGIGNLMYTAEELFQPISVINSPQGHGNVAMVNGYLMVIYSSDSGGTEGDGGIEFWDVSDPRNPKLRFAYDNDDTHGLREAHGFAFSNSYPGDYMVAQAIEGIQFWDLSNPSDIRLLSYLDLPGIEQGDYSGAWWTFWQAPYVYVAGIGSGLYIVDATDPENPVLLKRMLTSELADVNPATVFAVGNLLVAMEAAQRDYVTLDISDPANPFLLDSFGGKSGYSHIFAAGKILTSGGNGDAARMYVHNVTHDGEISFVGSAGSGLENGGYGSYQDGFFHSGFSDKYAKFDVETTATDGQPPPPQVGSGTSGIKDRDEDFAMVLGNVVFVGDDHGVGSGLLVHQIEPDDIGPDVHWVHPPDGATDIAYTSRVGVSMSDNIDIRSVDSATFVVRRKGGVALPGKYSVQMGLVNFSPDEPLLPGMQYEVMVSGVRDLVGNAGGEFVSEFTTRDLITNVISASGTPYEVDNLAPGSLIYVDQPDVFGDDMPSIYVGQQFIRTAKDDSASTGEDFVSFDLTADASVFVFFDDQATQLPAWLGDGTWSLASTGLITTDPNANRVAYHKEFEAGNVSLGGNADPPAEGVQSMYTVLAVSQAVTSARACIVGSRVPVVVGSEADFDASVIIGGDPIAFSWDFGDGSPATPESDESAASHTYDIAGRFAVILTVDFGSGIVACSATQIVHEAVAEPPPTRSSTIVHGGAAVYNVNPDNDTVSAIDAVSLTKLWEATVASHPRTLALAPSGDIWVISQADATINVLHSEDGALLDTIGLPHASRPYGIAFSPDGSAAYVTLEGVGKLLKLALSGEIVGEVDVGPKPRGLAVSSDSKRVLVTRFVSPVDQGEVRMVDAESMSLIDTIALAIDPGPDAESSGRGLPNYISSLTISPSGNSALVPSKKDNTARGLFRDGQELTFESTVRTIVSRIDLSTGEEAPEARIDLNDRNMANAAVFSPLGDIYFVAVQGNNVVEVFDFRTGDRIAGMNTGAAPQGLTLGANGSKLFVHNFMSRTISAFDVADLVSGVSNAATKLGEVPVVENESLFPDILQGKQIFYNASDPRISRDGYISCAACHAGGESDGVVWDFTQGGEGLRNTITLLGRGGTGHGNVHWTANFDEIQDFENNIRSLFGGAGLMTDQEFDATSDPLGPPKAGLSASLDALAAYVSSLVDVPDSPYREPDGSLTPDGVEGRKLFEAVDCASCHSGPFFADGERHDVGTAKPSSGLGIGQPLEGVGFDTPTLLGVWDTHPYLHDGGASGLKSLLNVMEHGGSRNLSDEEVDQLIAFILQIDGNEPAATPRVCGDQNGDRRLDILDVIMNLQFASGVSLAEAAQRVLGDVNRDGDQTFEDAVKTLQHLVDTNSANLNECGLP